MTPTAPALRAAKAITDKWQVGESTVFCDDAPEWEPAEESELAQLVDESTGLPAILSALERMLSHCDTSSNGETQFEKDATKARAVLAAARKQ